MQVWCGIDPGLTGALVRQYEDPEILERIEFYDMPIRTVLKGKKKKNIIAEGMLLQVLDDWNTVPRYASDPHDHIFLIEKQQAMPGQGVVSMFNHGYNYGVLIGSLIAVDAEFYYVTPQKWKKAMGLTSKDKGASVDLAIELFPDAESVLTTRRGRKLHGRADALLISEYLRRNYAEIKKSAQKNS